MDGELTEEDNHSFTDFRDFSQALEEGNLNVSTQMPLSLPPLPQRAYKKSRSNQNQNAGSRENSTATLKASTSSSNQDNDSNSEPLQTSKKITHTTSAPVVSDSNNKKRNRSSTSSSTSATTSKPVNKKSGKIDHTQSTNFRVSFAPQGNHASDENITPGTTTSTTTMNLGVTSGTSTTNAIAWSKDTHEMATGPNDKPERIIVNTLAKPMWDVTRQHLISQQKSQLRSVHLRGLLTQDIMPVEFFGAEPMKRYYATNNGILSEDMMALLGRQAREKAELVYKELVTQAEREQKNATYFAGLTAQIYTHERDDGFAEANVALQKVVTFYQKTETDRLEALAKRETERQPTTEAEWTNLVCQPLNQPNRADRSSSRGRKRQRKSTSGKRANQPNNPPPAHSETRNAPSASTSYMRQTSNTPQATPSNSRGNLNQGNQTQRPQQNQQGGQRPRNNPNYRGNKPQNQQYRQQNNNQPGPSNNSNNGYNTSNQGNQGNHQANQNQRRQDNNPQQRVEPRPDNNSRQPQRSNSTEKLMFAISALKAAMK